MKKNNTSIVTAEEALEILNKPWYTAEDIMKLSGYGENKAAKVRKEINEKLINEGFNVLDKYVPTDRLLKYFSINIEYLKTISDLINRNKE